MTKEEFIKKWIDGFMSGDEVKADLESLLQSPAAEVSDEIPDEQIDYLLKDQMGLPHYVKYESLAPTLKATYDYGKRILEMVRSKLQGRKEGWVSVKGRLPMKGELVLTSFLNTNSIQINHLRETALWEKQSISHPVTHWMPLPTAPEKEGGRDEC